MKLHLSQRFHMNCYITFCKRYIVKESLQATKVTDNVAYFQQKVLDGKIDELCRQCIKIADI